MIVKKLSNAGLYHADTTKQKKDLCMTKILEKEKSLKNRKDENVTHRFT